ncbi:hypothetical protein OAI33_13855 [Pirellulaceae bacterium]|nr:hypothetical protein [Pirellulaceae bacterium]
MIDYRIINFSHSLRDLETGQAAERFFSTLASSHKDIKLDDASNVGSSAWELVQNHKDGSDWIFENIVQVKLDTPPIDRGWHRFARLRSIYIDKDKRGFSLSTIRRCMRSLLDYMKKRKLPLFLVIKPFEEIDGEEVYSHSLKRQKALLDLFLDLGFQHMDKDKWNIKAEGSTEPFEERNKDYPLEIPFLIHVPQSSDKTTRGYFESLLGRC